MDAIRKRIFWILDNTCANCEMVKGKTDHYPICRHCPAYKELNELGTHLDDPKVQKDKRYKEPKIDLETYIDYKQEGWTDRDIAKDQSMSEQTLTAYKKKWGITMPHGGDRTKYLEQILSMVGGSSCQTT